MFGSTFGKVLKVDRTFSNTYLALVAPLQIVSQCFTQPMVSWQILK